jgi:hypothetical protein
MSAFNRLRLEIKYEGVEIAAVQQSTSASQEKATPGPDTHA